jgi:hypothetical protein
MLLDPTDIGMQRVPCLSGPPVLVNRRVTSALTRDVPHFSAGTAIQRRSTATRAAGNASDKLLADGGLLQRPRTTLPPRVRIERIDDVGAGRLPGVCQPPVSLPLLDY